MRGEEEDLREEEEAVSSLRAEVSRLKEEYSDSSRARASQEEEEEESEALLFSIRKSFAFLLKDLTRVQLLFLLLRMTLLS